jgi:hypothetical protein
MSLYFCHSSSSTLKGRVPFRNKNISPIPIIIYNACIALRHNSSYFFDLVCNVIMKPDSVPHFTHTYYILPLRVALESVKNMGMCSCK